MTLVERIGAVVRAVDAGDLTPERVAVAIIVTTVAGLCYGSWLLAAIWLGGTVAGVSPLLGLLVFGVMVASPVVAAACAVTAGLAGGGDP